VKRDPNPRFPQNIGHPKKLFPGRAVKDMAVETDFGIDLLFDDNGEILMKELLEGEVHLYFFKDITHDGLSALHDSGVRFFIITVAFKQPRNGPPGTNRNGEEANLNALIDKYQDPPALVCFDFQFDSIVKIC
jgi:hypothetical protein